MGELVLGGLRDLVVEGAIDVSNFDASWAGGPTVWRRAAGLCAAFGVEIGHHEVGGQAVDWHAVTGSVDRIVEVGGFITSATGGAPDANLIPIPKPVADAAMDASACIGCGACVAACPNSAAQLFTSAKLHHLNVLPQGQPERWRRTENMVETMEEYFGSCTNHGECEKACPKSVSIDFIAMMNADFVKAKFKNRRLVAQNG